MATTPTAPAPKPAPKTNRLGLPILEYRGGKTNLCAGCGHNAISERIIDAFYEMGLQPERVYKVKEGRPNVVDLIKSDRIQLIVNTPRGQDTFFDEKAIRRAAVMARIPTITTA